MIKESCNQIKLGFKKVEIKWCDKRKVVKKESCGKRKLWKKKVRIKKCCDKRKL